MLSPVNEPTINIRTWFVLFWFSFLTKVKVTYESAPPKTKVIRKKKPATDNDI